MTVAAPGVGRRLAGAREWVRVAGADSSRTSMCASAGEGAGAVLGLCANGQPVAASRSVNRSAAGGAPGNAAGGVYGSDCG